MTGGVRTGGMSPDTIRSLFSPDADSDLFILLTIYDPEDSTKVVMRLSDGFTKRITDNAAEEIVYGITSNNYDFTFLPMQITLPQEDEAQAPRCSITLNDVTRYITPIIRTITGPPKVLLQLVLAKTPDVIELSFSGLYINSFTYNADSVIADLAMIDYEREPFPAHSFSPKYFPGLF